MRWNRAAAGEGRRRRRLPTAALAVLLLFSSACVLPVRRAPAVVGAVVDAATGEPVAGARVVVRFESWYDDSLPDRQLLGHAETASDAEGRFRVGPLVRAGISAWPLLRTAARVVGVLADGYACPAPQILRPGGEIALARASLAERQASCRPVATGRGEADAYMHAWRALFPPRPTREAVEKQRQLERVVEARGLLGYGQNCTGPVLDLAIDPTGQRVAVVVAGPDGHEVQVVRIGADGSAARREVAELDIGRHERLAWVDAAELVIWEPATQAARARAGAVFGSHGFEVVWTAPDPAPALLDAESDPVLRPRDGADLNDEGDARWRGRGFQLRRDVDPATGLGLDHLAVTRPDGSRYELPLPGEACGPLGRFGRPHYRITAAGRSGVDLRFVDGGCHALQIDLTTGDWTRLAATRGAARCQLVRSVPAQQMVDGLRGYMRDVATALEAAGADPTTAYALHIDGERTIAVTRDLRGGKHSVSVPRFPLATPLRRIEVGVAGGRSPLLPRLPGSGPGPRPL